MKYRKFGRTGWKLSEVGFGALVLWCLSDWAIDGSWGSVDDRESTATLHKAVDIGINFFDTADVFGVSVERVKQGLKAVEFPNVQSVQIISNIFRQRPMELFFEQAIRREVGVLARVPLASRLLTGKFHAGSSFQSDDHRDFNRMGEFFDQGETFSGVDFSLALVTVDKLKLLLPSDCSGESKGRGQIRGRG